jgi:hypothetical protein
MNAIRKEWAVQLEDGFITGIWATEAEAVESLAKFDAEYPTIPAFIASRPIGQWAKRVKSVRPPRTRAYTVEELDTEAFRRILSEH